jgi:hypothetical protein
VEVILNTPHLALLMDAGINVLIHVFGGVPGHLRSNRDDQI